MIYHSSVVVHLYVSCPTWTRTWNMSSRCDIWLESSWFEVEWMELRMLIMLYREFEREGEV